MKRLLIFDFDGVLLDEIGELPLEFRPALPNSSPPRTGDPIGSGVTVSGLRNTAKFRAWRAKTVTRPCQPRL
jgi:hypothetical protein